MEESIKTITLDLDSVYQSIRNMLYSIGQMAQEPEMRAMIQDIDADQISFKMLQQDALSKIITAMQSHAADKSKSIVDMTNHQKPVFTLKLYDEYNHAIETTIKSSAELFIVHKVVAGWLELLAHPLFANLYQKAEGYLSELKSSMESHFTRPCWPAM